jgi:sigma-B regulation protein RsbU (phosphoserine phosphatase)
VLYTDGVTEAEDDRNNQFGRRKLEECVARHIGESARGIVDAVVEEVLAFAGDRGQSDDLTLMVVKALAT